MGFGKESYRDKARQTQFKKYLPDDSIEQATIWSHRDEISLCVILSYYLVGIAAGVFLQNSHLLKTEFFGGNK